MRWTDERLKELASKVNNFITTHKQRSTNTRAFSQLAQRLRDESCEVGYDQNTWCRATGREERESCKTVACLAGHATLLAGFTIEELSILNHEKEVDNPDALFDNISETDVPIGAIGGSYLGLGGWHNIFRMGAEGFPLKYRTKYRDACTWNEKRQVAAQLCQDIADGKVTI